MEPGARLGVALNELTQAEDEVDDVLGHDVGGSGLGPEQDGDGPLGGLAALDLQILVDNVQGVHLLPLVLVQALDLDVEDGFRVQGDALLPGKNIRQLPLLFRLDGQHPVQHGAVAGELHQLIELVGVSPPAPAHALVQQGGQLGVAHLQPPPQGDAVGLVVELGGVDVIEGLELGIFQNLGVQGGHAVHRPAVVDVQMGHVDDFLPLLALDDRHLGIGMGGLGPPVQLSEDGRQLGRGLLNEGQGPFLQRLGQDSVVGIGAGFGHLLHRLVHAKPPPGEQAHQLRDDHGGVGVVDLDDHVVAEGIQGAAPLLQLFQHQLGSGGHHEVLLVHPQQPSRLVAVVGVEEGGEAGGQVGLVEVDALLGGGGGGLHVKEVQAACGGGVSAGDGDVKQLGLHRAEAEGHFEFHTGGDEPALVLDPGVGPLGLLVVLELLLKQAVVVVEAHAVPVQAQGGDGVQEAGGQAAQAAVPQGGLGLHVLDSGQGAAALRQDGVHLVVNAKGQQVVAQQLADKELGGKIIQFPVPRGGWAGGGQLLSELEQAVVELAVAALGELQAIAGLGQLEKAGFNVHGSTPS